MDRLNYSDKGSWSIENAALIAAGYGYCLNENFLCALAVVIEDVQKAEAVTLLGSTASYTFMNWKPPLEKAPCTTIELDPIIKPKTTSIFQTIFKRNPNTASHK